MAQQNESLQVKGQNRGKLSFYLKTNSVHCSRPKIETAIRRDNLLGTTETGFPQYLPFAQTNTVSRIGPDGTISKQEAARLAGLHALIQPEDEFLKDEIGLLLNAGGFDLEAGQLTGPFGTEG